jgi:hypothetical protein
MLVEILSVIFEIRPTLVEIPSTLIETGPTDLEKQAVVREFAACDDDKLLSGSTYDFEVYEPDTSKHEIDTEFEQHDSVNEVYDFFSPEKTFFYCFIYFFCFRKPFPSVT